jgi:hypothetical protein
MKNLSFIPLLLTISLYFVSLCASQAQQKFNLEGQQEFKVSGTSTVHDWDMVSEGNQRGEAMIKLANGKIEEIRNLIIIIPARSLKSGRSGMDRNAYETLKADDHPEIKFELTSVDEITSDRIMAVGDLTIAGTTHSIPLEVNYVIQGNQLQFSGSKEITFQEFKMEPPRAMLGTIRTGDELAISFVSTFQ